MNEESEGVRERRLIQSCINIVMIFLCVQEPRRGLTPQALRKYARPGSFDELSRESKVLTV